MMSAAWNLTQLTTRYQMAQRDCSRSSKRRLNIRELDLETEVFRKYFDQMMRKRGETLIKYIHAEELAYRKLQRTLKEAMEGGHAEWSSDEDPNPNNPSSDPESFTDKVLKT